MRPIQCRSTGCLPPARPGPPAPVHAAARPPLRAIQRMQASTALSFDESTATRFATKKGGADIKSEDKTFHMLAGDDRVWAVASGGTIEREYRALAAIATAGVATVLAGELVKANYNGRPTMAYPMRWIDHGVSSKSQVKSFVQHLHAHRNKRLTRRALAAFERLKGKMDVRDFQVILDPATGDMLVNDPRGTGPASATGMIALKLKQWSDELGRLGASGGPPVAVGPPPRDLSDQASSSPAQPPAATTTVTLGYSDDGFLVTDWDATFDRRAREGGVSRLPATDLKRYFSKTDIDRLGWTNQRDFTNLADRTSWNMVHRSGDGRYYYFEPA